MKTRCALCFEPIDFNTSPVSAVLGHRSLCPPCFRLTDMNPELGRVTKLLLDRIQALEERIELLTRAE